MTMLAAFAIEMWFRACGQNPCSTLWVTPLVMARPALPDDGIPAAQRQSLPETLMPLLSSASTVSSCSNKCVYMLCLLHVHKALDAFSIYQLN